MPIEIRELHIRVNINAQQAESSAGTTSSAANAQAGMNEDDKQAIVAECVEQVLAVLQSKTER
ncbi:MAG: hypothetical protein IAE84_03800 [Saprospiraceae bacterium]|jgi:hypothetical protein|nr:hypothetical protein [Saprospiraceae bacterium]HRD83029.1 DUF5908 family protein [Saprospiraceae bacterium]HRJ17181.1 DUF5908 family protein [Saprospiraceae bacterium]